MQIHKAQDNPVLSLLTRRSVVGTQPRHLDGFCPHFGNLALSLPSCYLSMTWQLGSKINIIITSSKLEHVRPHPSESNIDNGAASNGKHFILESFFELGFTLERATQLSQRNVDDTLMFVEDPRRDLKKLFNLLVSVQSTVRLSI
ncbi:hypothetical protein CSKR_107026 [Clonorchis sinensis]|uniref:Uncharacterized protein n=1 Tax=Clonorchis sinensis TaxID=79923 RepID=A0A419PDP5_CLOSI|nr:hypothetical protein CSKR_107026 [Clonorchis sinensis]